MTLTPATSRGSGSGGGFSLGSSYLSATSADTAGNAGALTVPWTFQSSAGADIAIDGGDPTHLDILTTGWYGIRFHADVFPDGAAPLDGTTYRLCLNGAAPADSFDDQGPSVPGIQDFEDSAIEPWKALTAGDFIVVRLQVFTASTWGSAETRVLIVRLS